jgi:hypothetical protein
MTQLSREDNTSGELQPTCTSLGPHRLSSNAAMFSARTNGVGRYRLRVAPGRNFFYLAGPIPVHQYPGRRFGWPTLDDVQVSLPGVRMWGVPPGVHLVLREGETRRVPWRADPAIFGPEEDHGFWGAHPDKQPHRRAAKAARAM